MIVVIVVVVLVLVGLVLFTILGLLIVLAQYLTVMDGLGD